MPKRKTSVRSAEDRLVDNMRSRAEPHTLELPSRHMSACGILGNRQKRELVRTMDVMWDRSRCQSRWLLCSTRLWSIRYTKFCLSSLRVVALQSSLTGLREGLGRQCWASRTTARSACRHEERRGGNRVSAPITKQP